MRDIRLEDLYIHPDQKVKVFYFDNDRLRKSGKWEDMEILGHMELVTLKAVGDWLYLYIE